MAVLSRAAAVLFSQRRRAKGLAVALQNFFEILAGGLSRSVVWERAFGREIGSSINMGSVGTLPCVIGEEFGVELLGFFGDYELRTAGCQARVAAGGLTRISLLNQAMELCCCEVPLPWSCRRVEPVRCSMALDWPARSLGAEMNGDVADETDVSFSRSFAMAK